MNGPPKAKRAPALTRHSIPVAFEKTGATTEARCKKEYKPLPLQFRRDGFSYEQIVREGDVAIYKQTWSGCFDPSICYEVVRIRRRERFEIGGRAIEPAEVYPKSEAWGVGGWTFKEKEIAFAKLRELV